MSTTKHASTTSLALAALGVVYGDIGTSPLYTMGEIFGGAHHPVPINPQNILGILSVLFWSLMIVVSFKYVLFIMRADNKGEGGIMALMALVLSKSRQKVGLLMLLGLFGASLFYGDSVLTPAISVLSAVEGLSIASSSFNDYEVPLSLIVLVILFIVQKHGTSRVGGFFGPVMVIWFAVLGVLGIINIAHAPQVLSALNPIHAMQFFASNPALGYFALGATVLALTGGEALYADMGHFGRRPVQIAWFGLVLPGLLLNYYGQGALLLSNPAAIKNPFYLLTPSWALYPMVALSTVATVIASQAVISGAYSITRQAIQLGYSPRMEVQHTSQDEIGQIYLPAINWALMVAVAVLIIAFGTSSALAAAYGIAVTGTMVITTILAYVVTRNLWQWSLWKSSVVVGFFLIVDLAYFSSNLLKIGQGGWFPLALGGAIFLLMTTWKKGRRLLNRHLAEDMMPLNDFVKQMEGGIPLVPGTAVFMTQHLDRTPHALLHSVKHYKCLHERIVILTVDTHDEPHVAEAQRIQVTCINDKFYTVKVNFGFMDETDLPKALQRCDAQGLSLDMMDTSFFLGRETLIPRIGASMALWRERLFVAMFRNAGSAADYFRLPPNRVVELGSQIVL